MMNNSKCLGLMLVGVLMFSFSQPGFAQQEEFDHKEAVKKIRKQMEELVENLAELNVGKKDVEKSKKVVENIDELLKNMRSGQDDVIGGIDEILKNLKKQKAQSSGDSSDQSQNKDPGKSKDPKEGKQRDRNKKPGDKNDQRDGKSEDKPQDGKEKGKNGQTPKSPAESEGEAKNTKNQAKMPEGKVEKVPFVNDAEAWGRLPAEVRQLLIQNDFRDYFPDYEKEISDYLKSLNRKK